MIAADALIAGVVVAFIMPMAWSAVVALARHVSARRAPLGDRAEKAILAIMLTPVALGLALFVAARLPAVAETLPPPLLDLGDWRGGGEVAGGALADSAVARFDWLLAGATGLVCVYLAGVARFAALLIAAHIRLLRLVGQARHREGDIWAVDQPVTPFTARGRVIVPSVLLEMLNADEIALIAAHERRHIERGDGPYYALLAWIDALFWINPFVCAQSRSCRLAAELDCDAAVTAASPHMRRAYAQALVQALKHTAGDAASCAPAVFSSRKVGEHRMRILQIMQPGAPALGRQP